jgi:hypothetical protein
VSVRPSRTLRGVDRYARAEALVRATLSLADASLRASYVANLAREWDVNAFARALDVVCERAEQAQAASREALVAIVDALNGEGMAEVVQRLRDQTAGEPLLALERLVRPPLRAVRAAAGLRQGPVIDDGRGRPLTLGERKSLARRPDRDKMEQLLADPHPDVIRSLLRNPRITEDDVVRLAAKRPGRSEVLAVIARSTKWSHRPRVRMALVLNPATPSEIAARIAGLLLRPELDLVARSPGVPPIVRAVCLEHLERRPPVDRARDSGHRMH